MSGKEVPACARELALLDELRAACTKEDRPRIQTLLRQIRDMQRARLRQMTD